MSFFFYFAFRNWTQNRKQHGSYNILEPVAVCEQEFILILAVNFRKAESFVSYRYNRYMYGRYEVCAKPFAVTVISN